MVSNMRDNNLLVRDTTASMTDTETSSWFNIGGGTVNAGSGPIGMSLVVNVPKQSVGDLITAKLQVSTDGSTAQANEEIEILTVASTAAAVTTATQFVKPFRTKYDYARVEWTVAGTSPDFGAVEAHFASGQLQDNKLSVQ